MPPSVSIFTATYCARLYELTNHLGNVMATIKDKRIGWEITGDNKFDYFTPEVVSTIDYYPFGMEMPGRLNPATGSTYRFGMNGQMKDNEFTGQDGAHTTAMYWEYDSRIGRRWNLDPKPTIGISDYSCFGNNPILNVDLSGDSWHKGSVAKANNYKTNTTNRLNETNNKITSLNNQRTMAQGDESELAGIDSKLGELTQTKSELEGALQEFSIMENSSTVYKLTNVIGGAGLTKYKNGMVCMEYSDNQSMAHEMKHGFQYENKELSFNAHGTSGLLYDVNDEVAAYRRSLAWGSAHFSTYEQITPANVQGLYEYDPVLRKNDYRYASLSLNNLNCSTMLSVVDPIGASINGDKSLSEYMTYINNMYLNTGRAIIHVFKSQ